MANPRTLIVPRRLYDEMIGHARAEQPNECVGLLAGTVDGVVTRRYPLVNALADPKRFESEPRSMFAAEKARRSEGLELLAVYHSHPSSPAVPSKHDLANAYGPDVLSVIVSLAQAPAEVKAWRLLEDRFEPIELVVPAADS
jgi:proteasome lid subunit RPN8/RPN11